jgi:hypothetical protein
VGYRARTKSSPAAHEERTACRQRCPWSADAMVSSLKYPRLSCLATFSHDLERNRRIPSDRVRVLSQQEVKGSHHTIPSIWRTLTKRSQCDRELPVCSQCISAGTSCRYPPINKRYKESDLRETKLTVVLEASLRDTYHSSNSDYSKLSSSYWSFFPPSTAPRYRSKRNAFLIQIVGC